MRLILLLLAFAAPAGAAADDRAPLYGLWGTPAQCAGDLLVEGGSVRAAPFEIRPGWLRQGDHWCMLRWFPRHDREGGLFATAYAVCGEDSVQTYRLDMALTGETLALIWDISLKNGPLTRCPSS